MMNRRLLFFIVIFLCSLLTGKESFAITITASPSPAIVGVNVNIATTSTYAATPNCDIEVNFGDGPAWFNMGNCSGTPCNLNTNHIYATPGLYIVTARRTATCLAPFPFPPDPATTPLTVQPAVSVFVSPVPSTFNIPRGQSSMKNVMYRFTSTPSTNIQLTSSSGVFIAGGETIETNNSPVTANIQNGSGQTSESINIPVRVINRALNKGFNSFIYQRTFAAVSPPLTVTSTVNFHITTEAGADFDIKRIELYFENRRAEITVNRNFPKLKAYADIRFIGSGLLQGYWEVDGRILHYVNQHLTFAGGITLETPQIPPLPTFDTGTHLLKFIISNPVTEIPLPTILYFVTATEYREPITISLLSPENGSKNKYQPLTFEWEHISKSTTYLIEFYEERNKFPVFSAYIKTPAYQMPELVFKKIFNSNTIYYWKVKGFNSESDTIGESDVWEFTFE
jgi:hypothetical protein